MTTSIEGDDSLVVSLLHHDDDVLRGLQDAVVVVVERIRLEQSSEQHATFDERAILWAIRRQLSCLAHSGWSGEPAFPAIGGKGDLSVRG